MDSSLTVDRHELLNPGDSEARLHGSKVSQNALVVSDPSAEIIGTQYINLHRLPENLQKVQIVTDPLSGDILNHQVVELTADNEFVPSSVGAQYYDEELLPHDLTEEDKRLAAALVAVQLVQQQKQQHSILASELLKTTSMQPLSPLQNVSLEKPTVAAMVTSYFQTFDEDPTQQQLLDAQNQDRMLKLYQQPQPATTTALTDIRLTPLPPLKKVLSNQTLMRNRLDKTVLDQVQVPEPTLEPNKEIMKSDDGKVETSTSDTSLNDQQEGEEADSEGDSASNDLKSSKRSLPHKKRIPRILKTQPSVRTHKCTKCGLVFNTPSALTTHKATHANKVYTCELCKSQCSNQIKFFEHLKGHYEPVLQVPNAELPEEPILEYNVSTGPVIQDTFSLKAESSSERQMTEQVEHINIQQQQPQQHQQQQQQQAQPPQQPQQLQTSQQEPNFTCNICGRVFRREKAYETHITTAHTSYNQIEEFSEPEDMMEGIRHVVNIQAGSGDEEPDEKIRIWRYSDNLNIPPEMTIQSVKDANLAMIQEREEDKPLKIKKVIQCPHCARTFSHRNSLLYHVRSHSGRRPHQCDVCGKAFFASNALRVHMRMHSGDKPYKCEFCGRHFRQWGDLKYHMTSIHSNTKQYQCEFCGKDFARKYSLIVHRRIHTGEKNYVCEFCRKPFRASSYLVNHRRIHTGEKPYSCDICQKPFRVKSDMKRHRNTHNKEQNLNMVNVDERLDDSVPPDPLNVTNAEAATLLQEVAVSSAPTPLNLNMRSDNNDNIAFTRELERDANTLYVWIPESEETIISD